MRYTQAAIGRVFVLRFDHDDDFIKEVKNLALKEQISFATVTFIGALAKGDIVAGPKELKLPARSSWYSFNDGREVLGFGTVVRDGRTVESHIHLTLGKGEKAITGCLRANSKVFITVEAIVTELKGAKVSRRKDKKTGHKLLTLG